MIILFNNNNMNLNSLVPELQENILAHLSLDDILKYSRTCLSIRMVCDNYLKHRACVENIPLSLLPDKNVIAQYIRLLKYRKSGGDSLTLALSWLKKAIKDNDNFAIEWLSKYRFKPTFVRRHHDYLINPSIRSLAIVNLWPEIHDYIIDILSNTNRYKKMAIMDYYSKFFNYCTNYRKILGYESFDEEIMILCQHLDILIINYLSDEKNRKIEEFDDYVKLVSKINTIFGYLYKKCWYYHPHPSVVDFKTLGIYRWKQLVKQDHEDIHSNKVIGQVKLVARYH